MATNFKSFPAHIPEDGQSVWIRLFSVMSEGIPAYWDGTVGQWSHESFSQSIPWWFVVQWKNRPDA
jgi:hypothetical protein